MATENNVPCGCTMHNTAVRQLQCKIHLVIFSQAAEVDTKLLAPHGWHATGVPG
jgi:hypothetical protein